MSDNANDTARIESDLAQTRARLGTRLDELTRRLSPGQLLDEGLGYIRDGDGAVFARNLQRQIRDNPLPVTLTGIGLAWLAMSNGTGRKANESASRAVVPYDPTQPYGTPQMQAMRDDMAERAHQAGRTLTRATGEAEDTFRARIAEAQGKVLGVTRKVEETAESFASRVRHALDHATETAASWRGKASEHAHRAGDMAASGRERAGHAAADRASRAGTYASDAGARLANAMTENPLLLAAMGMTAGAVFGALLPQTEFEERQFSHAGEQAARTAKGMARDALQSGAHVVRAATEAGVQAAREEGASVSSKVGEQSRNSNGADAGDRPAGSS